MNPPGLTIHGRIAQCWLFVYRTPVAAVADRIPQPLCAMTAGGFAFWNIVVCRLEGMRPTFVPAALGLSYWHVAYRLHVRTESETGELLEGLCFLRSDCDRRVMKVAGNWLTDFHFHHAQVQVEEDTACVRGTIISAEAAATFEIDRAAEPQRSPGSPYDSLEAAARALEYKPAALSVVDPSSVRVVAVRRDPTAWHWRSVAVKAARWQLFEHCETELELCYEVDPVDYIWERPRLVRVKPCTS